MTPFIVRKIGLVVLPAHGVRDSRLSSDDDWRSGAVGIESKCCAAAEGGDSASVTPHCEIEMEAVVLDGRPARFGATAGDLVGPALFVDRTLVIDRWADGHCCAISKLDGAWCAFGVEVDGALVVDGGADSHCCSVGELDGLGILRSWGCDCKSSEQCGEELLVKHDCMKLLVLCDGKDRK